MAAANAVLAGYDTFLPLRSDRFLDAAVAPDQNDAGELVVVPHLGDDVVTVAQRNQRLVWIGKSKIGLPRVQFLLECLIIARGFQLQGGVRNVAIEIIDQRAVDFEQAYRIVQGMGGENIFLGTRRLRREFGFGGLVPFVLTACRKHERNKSKQQDSHRLTSCELVGKPGMGGRCRRRNAAEAIARSGVPLTARASNMGGPPYRQRKKERGALVHLAFGPHFPAVPGDDALDDGESDAGAGELVTMQPLKHAEQLVDVLHVEARAIVLDVVGGFLFDRRSSRSR